MPVHGSNRPHRSAATAGFVGKLMILPVADIVMAVAAAPIKRYTDAAALQLNDRAAYARAVFGGQTPASVVRPYRRRP